jgi:hypothetical protein
MLNNRENILAVKRPLLQLMPDQSWHIILKMTPLDNGDIECECIKLDQQRVHTFKNVLNEPPFHVAEGIWELSYGVQIMTLQHDTLRDHPAQQLLLSQQ